MTVRIGDTPISEFTGAVTGTADYAREEHTLAAGESVVINAANAATNLAWTAAGARIEYKNAEHDSDWTGADSILPATATDANHKTTAAANSDVPGARWWRITNDNTSGTITLTVTRIPQVDLSCASIEGAQLANDNTHAPGDWHTRRTPPNTWQIILNFSGTVQDPKQPKKTKNIKT